MLLCDRATITAMESCITTTLTSVPECAAFSLGLLQAVTPAVVAAAPAVATSLGLRSFTRKDMWIIATTTSVSNGRADRGSVRHTRPHAMARPGKFLRDYLWVQLVRTRFFGAATPLCRAAHRRGRRSCRCRATRSTAVSTQAISPQLDFQGWMLKERVLAMTEAGRKCPSKSGCDIACGEGNVLLSIADFQKKCGRGMGATVQPVPSGEEMEEWSRELLGVPKA